MTTEFDPVTIDVLLLVLPFIRKFRKFTQEMRNAKLRSIFVTSILESDDENVLPLEWMQNAILFPPGRGTLIYHPYYEFIKRFRGRRHGAVLLELQLFELLIMTKDRNLMMIELKQSNPLPRQAFWNVTSSYPVFVKK